MTAALALAVGGYCAFVAGLAWRTARAPGAPRSTDDAGLPTVTVVVAARDEEACLGRCLDALLAQDYPASRIEVVVADDHSVDRTAEVVRRYAEAARQGALVAAGDVDDAEPDRPVVRYVRVPDPEGPLRGKAHALHTAIAATTAEVVLVTDADCAPEPTWARALAGRFADPGVGIVCGMARIAPRPGRPFDRVQALDWTFLLASVSALAEAGAPATGMGNNMAVRRAAYDAVGGYPALPFSLTEDFTLVRAVADRTAWRVRFPLDARATVWTLPANGPGHAYRQRRRWARGGLGGGAAVLAAYAALFTVHVLPLAALVAAPAAGTAAAALGAKAAADGALLAAALRRVGGRLRLADLVAFEAFLFAYLVTLPAALALAPRVRWKGRRH
jgi:cellulose synthase/poly-beta-1,6-N-acetylglucosamine synthase-like glycosyltransferase